MAAAEEEQVPGVGEVGLAMPYEKELEDSSCSSNVEPTKKIAGFRLIK